MAPQDQEKSTQSLCPKGRFFLTGYYFITDSSFSIKGNISDVRGALQAKVGVVQYRSKHASTLKMYEEAKALKSLCQGTTFLINDRVDIALAVDADGIHLGQDDLPYGIARKLLGKKKIIGLTVHNIKEAQDAQRSGADYIGVSPIFSTTTKLDAGQPVGVKLIKELRGKITIPIVAIGGINLNNARGVVLAGADALCAISPVVTAPDVAKEISKFQKLFSV